MAAAVVAGLTLAMDCPIAEAIEMGRTLRKIARVADDVPISTPAFASNWELSASRAATVVRLFVETGIAAPRLTAIGHADNQPVEPGDTTEARARNRRVAVIIQAESEPGQIPLPRPATAAPPGGIPRK